MTAATLPFAVLSAMEESAAAHLGTLRQAIHVAQEACLHTETDPVPPSDDEDLARRRCRACRKILPA